MTDKLKIETRDSGEDRSWRHFSSENQEAHLWMNELLKYICVRILFEQLINDATCCWPSTFLLLFQPHGGCLSVCNCEKSFALVVELRKIFSQSASCCHLKKWLITQTHTHQMKLRAGKHQTINWIDSSFLLTDLSAFIQALLAVVC